MMKIISFPVIASHTTIILYMFLLALRPAQRSFGAYPKERASGGAYPKESASGGAYPKESASGGNEGDFIHTLEIHAFVVGSNFSLLSEEHKTHRLVVVS
jgi:hypothetical protein